MATKGGAISRFRKDATSQRSKNSKAAARCSTQGNESVYLCQTCSIQDDVEKVRCDQCMLWYHFDCANVTSDIVNQEEWMCDNCVPMDSEPKTGNLVDLETNANSQTSKLPPHTDKIFEAQRLANTSNRSSKAGSVISTVSRRASLALQRLEEERQLNEQRDKETRLRDKEYLNRKYSILEDDVMSNLSFDDEEVNLSKLESVQRWTEGIRKGGDQTFMRNEDNQLSTQPSNSTNVEHESHMDIVVSSSSQSELVGTVSRPTDTRGAYGETTNYPPTAVPEWLLNPSGSSQIHQPLSSFLQARYDLEQQLNSVVGTAPGNAVDVTSSIVNTTPVPTHTEPFNPNKRSDAIQQNLAVAYSHMRAQTTRVYTTNVQTKTYGLPSINKPFSSSSQPFGTTSVSTYTSVGSNCQTSLQSKAHASSSFVVPIQSVASISQPISSSQTFFDGGNDSSTYYQPMASLNYQANGAPYQNMVTTIASSQQPYGYSYSSQNIGSSYQNMGTTFTSNNQPYSYNNRALGSTYNSLVTSNMSTNYQQTYSQPVSSHLVGGTYSQPNATSNSSFGFQHQPPMFSNSVSSNQNPNMQQTVNHSYTNGNMLAQNVVGNADIQIKLTAEQIAARHVMPKDLPQFSGDPRDWEAFISAYENSTSTCGFSNSENLGRLQKCLKGDAKTAVHSRLLHRDSVPGVIHTLRMMYGRPELLIESMVEDIQKTPAPKDGDLASLIKFAIAVQNLSASIQNSGATEHLRNPTLMNSIIDKLPSNQQLSWAFHKQSIGNVNLYHLGEWLYNIADVASQVVRLSSKSHTRKGERKDSNTKDTNGNKSNSSTSSNFLNTQVENTATKNQSKADTKICPACKSSTCYKLVSCKKFKEISRAERWTIVKDNKLCNRCFGFHKFYRCQSNQSCRVDGCKSNHHTLLHNYESSLEVTAKNDQKSAEAKSTDIVKSTCNSQRSQINLRTDKFRIVPVMLHYKNQSVRDYAYLDDGSNMTTMEESLANELKLTGSTKELCVDWAFGQTHSTIDSKMVSVSISGYYQNAPRFKMSNVRTVKNLHLPTQSITSSWIEQYAHMKNVPIATYDSVKPRLLIGLQYSKLIVSLETIEGRENEPIVCRTRLGWVVQGPTIVDDNSSVVQTFSVNMCACQSNDNELHQLVKEYFTIENFGVSISEKKLESKEMQRANSILETTTLKKGDRFETSLLWKHDDVKLLSSYNMALKRFICLETKMTKNPKLKANLFKQIKEFVVKGYIRKLSTDEIKNCQERVWYLPTFPVFNPKKPEKVRLVWDGAAKVQNTSLNSNLLTGPDQLVPLPELLRRFQERAVAITGDIEEMFHQIKVQERDQHAQRFLWRDDPSQDMSVYVMMVMTFGSKCSPSVAQFVKNKNANEFQTQYPQAVESIVDNHYVDDMIDCTHTVEEAESLVKEVKIIHKAGGFNIRNFTSNSTELLQQIGEDGGQQSKNLNIDNKLGTERVLGMFWDTASDCFTYSLKFTSINDKMLSGEYCPTKREVLRILMSVFDPLGLVANFLIHGKILLQDIWRSQTEWDEQLPDPLHAKWAAWLNILLNVEKLRIPRLYSTKLSPKLPKSIQLHTFVDAGAEACAALTYLRIEDD